MNHEANRRCRTILGLLVYLSAISSGWVHAGEWFIWSNVTDEVVQNAYASVSAYTGFTSCPPDQAESFYGQAKVECDNSQPANSTYSDPDWWTIDASRQAGYGPPVWPALDPGVTAWRRDVSKHFEVNPAGLNPFLTAYGLTLEWREIIDGASVTTNSLNRILSHVKTATISNETYTISWPPWTDYMTDTYTVETTEPIVRAWIMTYEVIFEHVRPDVALSTWGDPVNLINGNVTVDETDIAIPCPGLPIVFSRAYNSLAGVAGPLGHRWTHSLNWSLWPTNTVFGESTNAWRVVETGEGRRYYFPVRTNGTFSSPVDVDWRLVATNQTFLLTVPPSTTYSFDTYGVLASVSDHWGNALTLTYTNAYPSNLLTRVEHSAGQVLAFAYDDNDMLSLVTSPDPQLYMTYSYNGEGELTNATRHSGARLDVFSYSYDSTTNHSLTQRINPANQTFSWTYATNDNGGVTSTGITTVVETNLFAATITRDSAGFPYAYVSDFRRGTNVFYRHQFHPVQNMIEEIRGPNAQNGGWDALGLGVLYQRDDWGNITNETAYDDEAGEWLTIKREFDACHHVTNEAVAFCADPSESWAYGWNTNSGLLESIRDPEGLQTEFEYTNGRLSRTSIRYGQGSFDTTFSYTTNGLLAAVTNANGHGTHFEYDEYGHLNQVAPQVGPIVTYSNSVLGHVLKMSMPGADGPRATRFDTDELGRVNSVTYPDAQVEHFRYDGIGNLTGHVDRAGRETVYTWEPGRNLASVTKTLIGDPDEMIQIAYAYDEQFNTLKISDPLERPVESYQLDIQDRPVSVTNLEGQTMEICYGLRSFVKWISRFDGTVISNQYDDVGRLMSVLYPDGSNSFSYLKNGLLEDARNSQGCVSNIYDCAGRLTETVAIGPTGGVEYAYLPAGQISNVQSVAGLTAYRYDAAERVTSLSNAHTIASYTYNTNNGLVARMTFTNGLSAVYEYDILDRLTGITWRDADTNVLRSFAYGRNTVGMITNVLLESGEAVSYTYDSLDRLTGERRVVDGGTEEYAISFSYDKAGNRTVKSWDDPDVDVSYQYQDGCNRLTNWSVSGEGGSVGTLEVRGASSEAIGTNTWLGRLYVSNLVAVTPRVAGTNYWTLSLPVGAGQQEIMAAIGDVAGNVGMASTTVTVAVVTNAVYAYNAAGCVTGITYSSAGGDDVLGLSWDAAYRLSEVTTNGGTALTCAYDALGRRVYYSDGVTTNWLVYDGWHVVAETDADKNLLRSYTWGPGIDNLLAFTDYTGGETNTYQTLTDHLGTVHALADTNGVIVESYRYDAWGRVLGVYDGGGTLLDESAVGNHYLFQGRWYAWSAELYYFRARWYDPVTGRWLSKDPIGISGGLNQYVFCGDNPVNRRDPFGLCDESSLGPEFDAFFESTQRFVESGGAAEYMRRYPRPRTSLSIEERAALLGIPTPAQIDQLEAVSAAIIGGSMLAGPGVEYVGIPLYNFITTPMGGFLAAEEAAVSFAWEYPTLAQWAPYAVPAAAAFVSGAAPGPPPDWVSSVIEAISWYAGGKVCEP